MTSTCTTSATCTTSTFPASRSPMPRRLAAMLATAAAVSLPAGAAAAHVRVLPDQTAAGSFSALTFRVPNESDTAGTVKVSVELPQDRPFRYVSAKPVPGWTAARTEATLPKPVEAEGATITKAVRTVTWTADKGRQIAPGEYQEFAISVGPLPDPGTVLLPAAQTYSDGKVVRWDQPTPAGGEEPERPAPALEITAGEDSDHQATDRDPAHQAPGESATVTAAAPTDGTARVLGGAGLLAGLAGLVGAALAWRRSARTDGRGR